MGLEKAAVFRIYSDDVISATVSGSMILYVFSSYHCLMIINLYKLKAKMGEQVCQAGRFVIAVLALVKWWASL